MGHNVDATNWGMLSKDQLQLGMRVKISQLSEVLDTHIILTDAEFCDVSDVIGVIAFMGSELNAESDKFVTQSNTAGVYNDSSEYEEVYTYDE